MWNKFKEVYQLSPWYLKIFFIIVLPLVIGLVLLQKASNIWELIQRGSYEAGKAKADAKVQELQREAAKTEGALDEIRKQKEAAKKEVDGESAGDLAEWFDDR